MLEGIPAIYLAFGISVPIAVGSFIGLCKQQKKADKIKSDLQRHG